MERFEKYGIFNSAKHFAEDQLQNYLVFEQIPRRKVLHIYS